MSFHLGLTEAAILAAAAGLAGAINSVAGGGTILSFPIAVALGLPPVTANATNAVALTPGSIASALAYRRELDADRAILKLFMPPAVIGSIAGAGLLLATPQALFDAIVPLLVLFATLLLLVQNLRRAAPAAKTSEWRVPQSKLVGTLLQLSIGLYGGYFGGGMGIMMLALYSRMGGGDIHRMNGVKSVVGAAINGVASIAFVLAGAFGVRAGAVDWRAGAVMAVGAVLGGFVGAAVARRVKPAIVRWVVVAIGFVITIALGYKRFVAS